MMLVMGLCLLWHVKVEFWFLLYITAGMIDQHSWRQGVLG
jgi:hypothetical protein